MKSHISVATALFLLGSMILLSTFGVEGASQKILAEDNFENYTVGTFPSEGGWQLWANGAGDKWQVVTDSVSASPSKSMQLLGQDGGFGGAWAAYVSIPFKSSAPKIGYEVNVRVEDINGGSRDNARIAFSSKTSSSYILREYAAVFFDDRGSIVTGSSGDQVSQPYVTDKWYNVKSILDRETETYSVWIDGVLLGENLAVTTTAGDISTYPTSLIEAFSVLQHYNSVKIYFDDVRVFAIGDPTPSPEPTGTDSSLSVTEPPPSGTDSTLSVTDCPPSETTDSVPSGTDSPLSRTGSEINGAETPIIIALIVLALVQFVTLAVVLKKR
jgi:hypothetical protein